LFSGETELQAELLVTINKASDNLKQLNVVKPPTCMPFAPKIKLHWNSLAAHMGILD
jgi:hypothetical protein